MIDNSYKIATSELMLRDVASKRGVSIKFEAHGSYFSGITVMNFVLPDNFSSIQIDRTLRTTPFGPASVLRIS